MANIHDLKRSVTELSDKDGIDLLLSIRYNRRTNAEHRRVRRASTKAPKPAQSKNKLLSAIGGLTPEQAQLLLEELQNEAE